MEGLSESNANLLYCHYQRELINTHSSVSKDTVTSTKSQHSKRLISFLQRAKQIHGDRYDYSVTKFGVPNCRHRIRIRCEIHGIFKENPVNHLKKGGGCPFCRKVDVQSKMNIGQKNRFRCFLQKAKKRHHDQYDYNKSQYVNHATEIAIRCKIHGIFYMSPRQHSHGDGCPKCHVPLPKCHVPLPKSIQWLNQIASTGNINIQHKYNGGEFKVDQYTVDGYCTTNNTIYEFYGDYYHGNPLIYEEDALFYNGKTMGEIYKKTMQREQYLKDKGYNVITIWETDWDQLHITP